MLALDHPLHWYRYLICDSIELLDTYINDIENQVDIGIRRFQQEAQEVEVEGVCEEDYPRLVTFHQGLNDGTWDLNAVFVDYFPGLQRRSALITLFSFFEHELNRICDRLQATEKSDISVRDIAGNGIERARTYLCKVAKLDLEQAAVQWAEVKSIQAVRNILVHADGQLHNKVPESVRSYIVKSKFLEGAGEIVILKGFLQHVLRTFDAFFEKIDSAIRDRFGAD